MNRRYLKRAMGLLHEGRFVEMTPYHLNGNTIDADGSLDGAPFDSLNDLMAAAQWDAPKASAFIQRVNEILSMK